MKIVSFAMIEVCLWIPSEITMLIAVMIEMTHKNDKNNKK